MQATEPGRLTSRQIEAARMAITRHVKRAGKLWIRIFPDRPVTKKPLEVRMGGGKGGVEEWAAEVQPGRVMYEISGVDEKMAREAFRLAGHKLPVGYKFLDPRSAVMMKAKDLRERTSEDLRELEKTLASDVFQNRFKNFTNRLDDTSSIRKAQQGPRARHDRAHRARARHHAESRRPRGARRRRQPKAAKPKKAAAPKAEAKAAAAAEPAKPAKKTAAKKTAKKSEAK